MLNTKWVLDHDHSNIGFKVKHMMFTNVSGNFKKFTAEVETDGDNFENSSISFTAETASISTNQEDRDKHLRTADFFDVENYPYLTFKSKSLTKIDNSNYVLIGDMTIRNVTKTIELKADFGGLIKDPWGNTRASFLLETNINRSEFELNWNTVLEAGGVLVSDQVRIICEIELIKQ